MTWIQFWTLFQREISRFLKVVMQTVFAPFISSFLYLLVFGVTLGQHVQLNGELSYLAYLIPGLMMMGLINNSYQNSSSSIVNMKFTGDLEDLRVVPLSNQTIVWAMALAAWVRGMIVALVTWLVGSLFMYWQSGKLLGLAHPGIFLFFSLVAGLSFGHIGIAMALWSKTMDQLSAFSSFVLLPLIYLGGVFISLEKLSPFWRAVAQWNPLLYFIEGFRYSFLGYCNVSIERAMLISVFGLGFFYWQALRSLRPGRFSRW
ncbi:MAG: transporter integral rane protein [Pseudomonadota bacterium]|jgi:ABC-2 type transport system permease protein